MAFEGLGLLVGMIVGAGMFALPYSVVSAGIWWSLFYFVLVGGVVTVFHTLYGHILFYHPERKRLPGYTREYFGPVGYWVAFLSRFLSYLGYLLVYGVLAGLFLSYIVPVSSKSLTVLFFVVSGLVLLLKPKRANMLNAWLAAILIGFIIFLFLILAPRLHFEDMPLHGNGTDWFLPYGIFLFAFSGASVIPKVVDVFHEQHRKLFFQTVLAATILVGFLYFLFILSIVGIAGHTVTPDALGSLRASGGGTLFMIGTIIGILAVVTSYFALGLELMFTFEYDAAWPHALAWAVSSLGPLALYLLGINNFILILGVVGAVGVGIEGILILLLARKVLRTNLFLVSALLTLLTTGALIEIAGAANIL